MEIRYAIFDSKTKINNFYFHDSLIFLRPTYKYIIRFNITMSYSIFNQVNNCSNNPRKNLLYLSDIQIQHIVPKMLMQSYWILHIFHNNMNLYINKDVLIVCLRRLGPYWWYFDVRVGYVKTIFQNILVSFCGVIKVCIFSIFLQHIFCHCGLPI